MHLEFEWNLAHDEVHCEHEERFFSMGHAISCDTLAIVHTFSETGLIANVRIISAKKATKREINQYKQNKQ